jgi:hypothetical protein
MAEMLNIPVPGQNPQTILESGYKLSNGDVICLYNVQFYHGMDNDSIKTIIRTAAGVGETRVRCHGMKGIAFVPQLMESDHARTVELATRVLALGWEGLVVAPWLLWHVKTLWDMCLDHTFKPDDLRKQLLEKATDIFVYATGAGKEDITIVSVPHFIGRPRADKALAVFLLHYPKFKMLRMPSGFGITPPF